MLPSRCIFVLALSPRRSITIWRMQASKAAGSAGRRRNYFASSFRVIRKREREGEQRANAILGAC